MPKRPDPDYNRADEEAEKGLAIFRPVLIWSSVVLVVGLLIGVLWVKIGAKKILAPPTPHSYLILSTTPDIPVAV